MRVIFGAALVLAALCGLLGAQQLPGGFPPGAFSNKAALDGGGGGPPPGITHVQGGGSFNSSSSSTWSTTLSPVGSGNALCIAVGYVNGTADTISIADGHSNTYTQVDQSSQSGFQWTTFYAINVTGSPTVITVTDSTSPRSFNGMVVDEYTGVATSSALDGHAINPQTNAATSTDAVTSGSITTGTSGDLICSMVVTTAGGISANGTGFTAATSDAAGAGVFWSEYQVQSSAGSIAGTWSTSAGTNGFVTGVIALKP